MFIWREQGRSVRLEQPLAKVILSSAKHACVKEWYAYLPLS